jgi:predicted nucleic acid-binding protein
MLKYMLDTNIVIYVIKRRPIELLAVFNRHAGQMCISSITLAELLHGVEKSAMPDHNLRQIEDFITRLEVLAYGGKATAFLRINSTSLVLNDATNRRPVSNPSGSLTGPGTVSGR